MTRMQMIGPPVINFELRALPSHPIINQPFYIHSPKVVSIKLLLFFITAIWLWLHA